MLTGGLLSCVLVSVPVLLAPGGSLVLAYRLAPRVPLWLACPSGP